MSGSHQAAAAGLATLYPKQLKVDGRLGQLRRSNRHKALEQPAARRAVEELKLDAVVCRPAASDTAQEPLDTGAPQRAPRQLPAHDREAARGLCWRRTRKGNLNRRRPWAASPATSWFPRQHAYPSCSARCSRCRSGPTCRSIVARRRSFSATAAHRPPGPRRDNRPRHVSRGAQGDDTGIDPGRRSLKRSVSPAARPGRSRLPTGQKWRLARETPADVKYIVCNADEGEPAHTWTGRCWRAIPTPSSKAC